MRNQHHHRLTVASKRLCKIKRFRKRRRFGPDDLLQWMLAIWRIERRRLARLDPFGSARSVMIKLGASSNTRGVTFAEPYVLAIAAACDDLPDMLSRVVIMIRAFEPALVSAIEIFRDMRAAGRGAPDYESALTSLIVAARLCR